MGSDARARSASQGRATSRRAKYAQLVMMPLWTTVNSLRGSDLCGWQLVTARETSMGQGWRVSQLDVRRRAHPKGHRGWPSCKRMEGEQVSATARQTSREETAHRV